MKWMRTTTLGLSGGAVVALLATVSTPAIRPRTPVDVPARSARSAQTRQETVVVVETERLRDRSQAAVEPRLAVRRNLFAFTPRKIEVDSPRPAEVTPAFVETPRPTPLPSWQLIGIATSRASGGAPRTAIVTDSGSLLFLTVGDLLPDGRRVVAVGEDSVELSADGSPAILLTLRQ